MVVVVVMMMTMIYRYSCGSGLQSKVSLLSYLIAGNQCSSFSDLVLQSNSDHNNMKGPLYLDIKDKNTVGVHRCMGEGDFKRLACSLTRVIITIMLFCFSEAVVALWHHNLQKKKRMLKTLK